MKIQKVVTVSKYGEPDMLKIRSIPILEPNKGEFRIRLLAAGISWADVGKRYGIYPGGSKPPIMVLGYDAVGIVDKLGEDANNFKIGERVAVLTNSEGAYTEYMCTKEKYLVPVPEGVDSAEAVSLVLIEHIQETLKSTEKNLSGGLKFVYRLKDRK